MADFEINKGVGREVEFKGLRAQYLFIFAAGLLAVFVMFVIMYMAETHWPTPWETDLWLF